MPVAARVRRSASRSAPASARSTALITTVLRVPSLVVTLAALYIIRGIDAVIVNGKQIDPTSIPRALPEDRLRALLGIPWLAIIVAVIIALAALCDAVVPLQP